MASLSSLVVSAPAKVILHGEHAVVYGKVALAASLNLRTVLTWMQLSEEKVELQLIDFSFHVSWTIAQLDSQLLSFEKGDITNPEAISHDLVSLFETFLCETLSEVSTTTFSAALTFLVLYKVICGRTGRLLPGKFVVKSKVPVGAGLGSSASYCVALATSLLLATGALCPADMNEINHDTDIKHDSLKLVNQWAFLGESLLHGNPSGIDNTVSTYGAFVKFQNGKVDNLQSVPELNIILINTNVPRSTKTMVGALRERYNEMPRVYDPLFSAMGAITLESIEVLDHLDKTEGGALSAAEGTGNNDNNIKKLEKLIDINQELLRIVGVSHTVIDQVCAKMLTYGFHSKLTGAGGGGCVVALINQELTPDKMDKLCLELNNIGCQSWQTTLGGNGVTIDQWKE